MHFERPQGPLAVGWPQARGGLRIGARELGVQVAGRPALGSCPDRIPDVFGNGGHVGEALGQRPEVEAGASDEDDRRFPRRVEDFPRATRPSSDGVS